MNSKEADAMHSSNLQLSDPAQDIAISSGFAPLLMAMPSIMDAFRAYFSTRNRKLYLAELLDDLQPIWEDILHIEWVEEAELTSVAELLAFLRYFRNNVEAGRDRCFNDSGIDLQSLIDRCSVRMSNGDVSGCYDLVGDIQAWLLVELEARKDRWEYLRGIYDELITMLESVQDTSLTLCYHVRESCSGSETGK